jgi:hypothetical protein
MGFVVFLFFVLCEVPAINGTGYSRLTDSSGTLS